MSLAKVWVVRDPSNSSALEDVCFELEVARLDRYILGAPDAWSREHHAIFVTREEADVEARARFKQLAERFAEIATAPAPRKGRTK